LSTNFFGTTHEGDLDKKNKSYTISLLLLSLFLRQQMDHPHSREPSQPYQLYIYSEHLPYWNAHGLVSSGIEKEDARGEESYLRLLKALDDLHGKLFRPIMSGLVDRYRGTDEYFHNIEKFSP
jgi:hypothetical protein